MAKPQLNAAYNGQTVGALFGDLHQLFQEHKAQRDFIEAVRVAIRKHPEMSEWIGDEQAALAANANAPVKASRVKRRLR